MAAGQLSRNYPLPFTNENKLHLCGNSPLPCLNCCSHPEYVHCPVYTNSHCKRSGIILCPLQTISTQEYGWHSGAFYGFRISYQIFLGSLLVVSEDDTRYFTRILQRYSPMTLDVVASSAERETGSSSQ